MADSTEIVVNRGGYALMPSWFPVVFPLTALLAAILLWAVWRAEPDVFVLMLRDVVGLAILALSLVLVPVIVWGTDVRRFEVEKDRLVVQRGLWVMRALTHDILEVDAFPVRRWTPRRGRLTAYRIFVKMTSGRAWLLDRITPEAGNELVGMFRRLNKPVRVFPEP